jgi:hypothetical protein
MDLSRHSSVFSPSRINKPIHIIGVGATGSFLAQGLVRMGVPVLNIYDFDAVEIHNIPNQSFDTTDIGNLKIDAMKKKLEAINPEVNIKCFNKRIEKKDIANMSGYVFLLVDSMAVRKELWEGIKNNPNISYAWESRLGSDQGRVYCLKMDINKKLFKKYEQDFYDDDVAEISACGTSITVLPVVLQTVSLMLVQFIDIIMEKSEPVFKTIFDHYYNKYEQMWQEPKQEEDSEANKKLEILVDF